MLEKQGRRLLFSVRFLGADGHGSSALWFEATTFIGSGHNKAVSCIRFYYNSHQSQTNLPLIQPIGCDGTRDSQNCRDTFCNFHKKSSNYHNSYITRPQTQAPGYYISLNSNPSRTDYCYRHSSKILQPGNYQVLRANNLQHWFKNWPEQRKLKLTASTFGGAVGLWCGRRVKLWKEKVGLIEPFTGNRATLWNNRNEEIALERYILITGNTVSFPGFELCNNTSPSDDWLAASPDGVIESGIYGLLLGGMLEIKCPYFKGKAERALPWSRLPHHYVPQAQGLLEILDKSWMDFYVWTPNGSSLFRLERDRQYWDLLKPALSDFWWMHVQPAKELFCRATFTEIMLLEPGPRHELCDTIVYESRRLANNAKLLVREINGKMVR